LARSQLRATTGLRLRSLVLCAPAALALAVVMPAPAQAAASPSAVHGVRVGSLMSALAHGHLGTVSIEVPASLPDLTVRSGNVSLAITDGDHAGSLDSHVSIGRQVLAGAGHAVVIRRVAHADHGSSMRHTTSLAAGPGPLAVTAPGLVSVVPIGPAPTGLRPHVAAGQAEALTPNTVATLGRVLPAPSLGFWFGAILLVLLLGAATFVVGDRRFYSVAVSMTKR
jgi:hypothetical protein